MHHTSAYICNWTKYIPYQQTNGNLKLFLKKVASVTSSQ